VALINFTKKSQSKKDVESPVANDIKEKHDKKTEFPCARLHIDYKQGTEKQVMESIKNDIHELIKNLGWPKSSVSYRIVKVGKHPHLEPGYIYEMQLNGDGGSYIESVLNAFKEEDVRHVWVESTKGKWNFIEIKNNVVDTNWVEMPPSEGEVVASFKGKTHNMKPFYVESYIFYYISLLIFFMATMSVFGAAMFKYVIYDKEKMLLNKQYYTPDKYMSVDVMLNAKSTSERRLLAIKYTKAKGWHIILQEIIDEESVYFEQKINQSGTTSEPVKIKSEAMSTDSTLITNGDLDAN
jgi:hypothetical protein